MEVTFFQKGLKKSEEKQFIDYVNQKLPAIEKMLTKFADDAWILKVTAQKFAKHDAFQVELCLTLPTKSLIAEEASHQITKAVDLSKDRLVSQIKKHMAMLRNSRAHQSIRGDKSELKKLARVGDIF